MAERVGVLGRLRFDSQQAVGSMDRASKAFGGLNKQAKLMKAGLTDLNAGMGQLAVAGVAIGAAGGFAIKKFADFGGQMGAVQAVLQTSQSNFNKLEKVAKELGRTTSFTAVQAAEAMENFARAGFDTTQVISGLSPVLSAAEADGIDLATASDIVASNIKAFGLEAEDAARVADTLAFVSAKTNTNMIGLGEGLKFAAPVANQLGIELEDTTAILGALADIGIKGTLSGTAFKNALLQISKQAKNGKVNVGGMAVEIKSLDDGSLDMTETFKRVVKRLSQITDRTKRSSAAMDLLGLRGLSTGAAFEALGKDQKKMILLLGRNADGMSNLAVSAKGMAKRMAEIRLKNLRGDFVRFGSAIDGVATEIGEALSNTIGLGSGLQNLTGFISQAAAAFQRFGESPALLEQKVALKGVDTAASEMVQGFLLGLRDVGDAVAGTVTFISEMGKEFGLFTGEGTQGTVKLVTKMAGLITVLGGVALAAKATSTVFGGLLKTGIGTAKILGGVLGGITKVGGGILTKIPGLARVLPGAVGKLAGAVGGLERLTAAPVRVVNFNEAAGGVGGGVTAATTAAGTKLGIGAKIKSLGGIKALAKKAGFVGLALGVGLGFGKIITEFTGSTEKFSNALFKATQTRKIERLKIADTLSAAALSAKTTADVFVRRAALGKKDIALGAREGQAAGTFKLTRELATQRITKSLEKQGITQKQIGLILERLTDTLDKVESGSGKPIVVEATLNVDGKPVAKSLAQVLAERRERLGQKPKGTTPRLKAKQGDL